MKPSDLVDEIQRYLDRLNLNDDSCIESLVDVYEHVLGRTCLAEPSPEEIRVTCDCCGGSGQVMSEGFINLGQGNMKRTEHWNMCPECDGKGWQ